MPSTRTWATGARRRSSRERAREANRRIFDRARSDASVSGMGTTLTGALLASDEVSIVHVGDSRAYLFRDGEPSPAHARPFARRGAAPARAAHERGGRGSSAALDHHAGARAGARRRGRRPHTSGTQRRRLPALQRRADEHGPGGPRARDPDGGGHAQGRRRPARRRGQRCRWAGQHHGRRVSRRGRRAVLAVPRRDRHGPAHGGRGSVLERRAPNRRAHRGAHAGGARRGRGRRKQGGAAAEFRLRRGNAHGSSRKRRALRDARADGRGGP